MIRIYDRRHHRIEIQEPRQQRAALVGREAELLATASEQIGAGRERVERHEEAGGRERRHGRRAQWSQPAYRPCSGAYALAYTNSLRNRDEWRSLPRMVAPAIF